LVDVDRRRVRRARVDLAGSTVDDVHHGAVGGLLDLAATMLWNIFFSDMGGIPPHETGAAT